ncbi:hypothetical protein FACS1894186_2790 [Alphaproteobacteria bacterium]|nr:hypothetical protein FACS1894186_2790 [Alphaproteobacteria bacterium]
MLPGVECRFARQAGLRGSGRLLVRGAGVCMGYLAAGGGLAPSADADGWLDTGDAGSLSADGFLKLTGRVRRAVRVGGELVGLAAVEAALARLFPSADYAAEADDDILLLATTRKTLRVSEIARAFREAGLPAIWVPRRILAVDALPRLASGKIDHAGVARLLRQGIASGSRITLDPDAPAE